MIRISGLTKRYRNMYALRGLDLEVPQGSIFGLIGKNGAGKTTTMRILATLLLPTAGQATVGGYDVVSQPYDVRKLIGYMPDFFGVYDDLKATEYLDFYAGAQGVPARERPALVRDLLELVDLSHKHDAYVDDLSRGMKQRLCLARALVHDPALLILDEPASGLDPGARIEMRELLKELRNMGKTILISSHILTELADLCTHIGIIDDGRLVLAGPVDAVLRQHGVASNGAVAAAGAVAGDGDGVVAGDGARVGDGASAGALSVRVMRVRLAGGRHGPDVETALAEVPGVRNVVPSGDQYHVSIAGDDEAVAAVLHNIISAGLPVVSFGEVMGNLEELFLTTTMKEGAER